MKKCNSRYSVGPNGISRSPALTRWLESSSFRPSASTTSGAPAGAARRSTALVGGQQFARREGLGNVVIGPALEAAHLVLLLGARGEHDDRNLFRVLGAFQRSRELEP